MSKTHGFNSEIKHKGKLYHVQTQDKGPSAQYIESIIYRSGKFLSMKKSYYTDFMNNPDLKTHINRMIRDQHSKILENISQGKIDSDNS